MNDIPLMEAEIEKRKRAAKDWFLALRDEICAAFETIEGELTGTPHRSLPKGRFERKPWQREANGGGGEMSILRGRVFEKVGVNISTVFGTFSEEFRQQIPGAEDGRFWASGISVVAHMRSPFVPAVHMNTRYLVTSKDWFGGGADLTPMFLDHPSALEDAQSFHKSLQKACDERGDISYARYKKWCDDYFYLPHRREHRGAGGIFFDQLALDWAKDFSFIQNVGRGFLSIYSDIVRRRMETPWTADDREAQRIRRGRYVEFNLLYDRGRRLAQDQRKYGSHPHVPTPRRRLAISDRNQFVIASFADFVSTRPKIIGSKRRIKRQAPLL